MVIRTSIFDRYSEQRLAREALERAQAEQAAAEQEAAAALPAKVPVTPMVASPTSFNFGGFNFAFPQGFSFQDIDASLDHEGHRVTLSIQRRKASELLGLGEAFGAAAQALRERHPLLRIVRQRECLLAGSEAIALDYHTKAGAGELHGRLVVALVPVEGTGARQILSISCVIDPSIEALSTWLIMFDHMLNGLAAH